MLSESKSLTLSQQTGAQEKLAIFLAFIAGYIDATGLIKWKTYVSFMSGNTTQLGAAVFTDKSGVIITSVTVISCFLLGIFTGTCLSLWKKIDIPKLPFFIVSGILVFYTITSFYYSIAPIPSIAIIGFSMGIMNTIVTSVGNQKVNTDFVTGTLNSLARNTAMFAMTTDETQRKEYRLNAIHLLLLWTGFLSGAAVASPLSDILGNFILGLPAVLLLLCGLLIPISTLKTK